MSTTGAAAGNGEPNQMAPTHSGQGDSGGVHGDEGSAAFASGRSESSTRWGRAEGGNRRDERGSGRPRRGGFGVAGRGATRGGKESRPDRQNKFWSGGDGRARSRNRPPRRGIHTSFGTRAGRGGPVLTGREFPSFEEGWIEKKKPYPLYKASNKWEDDDWIEKKKENPFPSFKGSNEWDDVC
ncbi:unnamed protein product [Gongylonema pulchrum]|uniref:Btz domain-containing protein n=1 Tax=Gongylonema pulchrum TaxID=637853 RepID=A0A183D4D9_9BILA|nr:unnamed protein product [Gongylonema pulchrum]